MACSKVFVPYSLRFFLTALFILNFHSFVFGQSKFKVVTTFTIIADMASNVAGDVAEIVSITKPGAEIHGYEPTPKDLARAYDADLVLWNGMNLELWFQQFLQNLNDVPFITVTKDVRPIMISSGEYLGKPNPHAWMGLQEARIYIDNIASALSFYDPKNANKYQANAHLYKDKIKKALLPYRSLIEQIPENERWLVTCEGAFSYLARDLGLKELYLWPMNADEVGTPKQIKRVIDKVRENSIPVIFCESTVSNAAAIQITRETDAEFGGVLYVDSLSGAEGPVPTYLELLKVTISTIANGLRSK